MPRVICFPGWTLTEMLLQAGFEFPVAVSHPLCLGYAGQCGDSRTNRSSTDAARFPQVPAAGAL